MQLMELSEINRVADRIHALLVHQLVGPQHMPRVRERTLARVVHLDTVPIDIYFPWRTPATTQP